MKSLLLALLLIPMVSQAQLSAKVTAASNYIVRGLSFTNGGTAFAASGQPVIQGQLDYTLGDFSATFFTSPVDSMNLDTFASEKDNEVDYFLNYNKKVTENFSFGGSLLYYAFVRNESNNTSAVSLNAMYSFVRVDWAKANNYAGLKTDLTYTMVSLWLPVSAKVMLTPAIGKSEWSDETKVGMSNYTDYKLGFRVSITPKVDTDFAYTNTSGRKDLIVTGEEIKTDKAVTFSISSTFDL